MNNFVEKNIVAITGIGAITPIGNSVAQILDSLKNCRDGIRNATKIDTSSFASKICGEFDFDFAENMTPQELEIFDNTFVRLALNSARMAIKDSEVLANSFDAMVLATCNGGLTSGELEYLIKYGVVDKDYTRKDKLQYEFYGLPKAFAYALNSNAPIFMVNTACSGATAAIGLAKSLIESGKFSRVLVGAADAMAISNFAGFSALKVVSTQKIAPFSTPEGMNLGEGAAFWVLENLEIAKSRNANIYGKVIGHATGADAHHPTQPDPRGEGAYRVMEAAIKNAGITIEQLGCINAHGSGTSANDKAESKGIAKFLNGRNIPVTSTKSYTGHCMGATGIIEATCQLLAMNSDFIPPTLRNSGARAGVEITAVEGDGINTAYDCFLSANYAFAGNNSAIVVAKKDFENFKKDDVSISLKPVITGVDAVSSIGLGMDEILGNLDSDILGISDCNRFQSNYKGGFVNLPNIRALDRRIDFSGMNRISIYATIAAKKALDEAKIQVRRENSSDVGIAACVCKGANDAPHFDAVFGRAENKGDISCFSNMTANSTAGWVSKALEIKGANITLTSGHNSGLQALAYAADVIKQGAAKQVVALGADELFKESLDTYAELGYLRSSVEAADFKLRYNDALKTVMGEGACAFVVESAVSAKERGAKILGAILGFGSSMDIDDFDGANLDGIGLEIAVKAALKDAKLSSENIDIIVWSPRGCAQDAKYISLRDTMFASKPMVTTVFNTGYIESSSILLSLGATLKSISESKQIWKQRSGVELLDEAKFSDSPKFILAISSSFTGANYAMVVQAKF